MACTLSPPFPPRAQKHTSTHSLAYTHLRVHRHSRWRAQRITSQAEYTSTCWHTRARTEIYVWMQGLEDAEDEMASWPKVNVPARDKKVVQQAVKKGQMLM